MVKVLVWRVLQLAILSILIAGVSITTLGQGKGRGGGGGGRGAGGGASQGGPPPGVGVDRGIDNSSRRSDGRADSGRNTASTKSEGRSDAGLERARAASKNLRNADDELTDHPGLARSLNVGANQLRSDYQAALSVNPNLKFGHFVSATRLGQNLNSRHPAITRDAILTGLASGRSLGRTLQDLGLSEREANEAKKEAERQNKRARN